MTRVALRAALEAGRKAHNPSSAMLPIGELGFQSDEAALWAGDRAAWRRLAESPRWGVRNFISDIDIATAAFKVETIPDLSFRLYRRFDTDGDRLSFEDAYFSRRRRLTASALRYLLRREAADLAVLEDILWTIAGEYSWALPAHLDGRSLTESGHETAIDLFAGETAFAFAEVLELMGSALSPVVAERVRTEVFRRVLDPFMAGTDHYAWEAMRNNWAAVCAASVGSAALYLIADLERSAAVLDRLWPCFGHFIGSFTGDGACLEGIGYWTYGFGFFTAFAELLRARTAGTIDLLGSDPKIERIARFQQRAYLNGHYAVSFADGAADERYRLGLAQRLAKRFAKVRTPPVALAAGFYDDPCGRWCLAVRDLIWGNDPPLGNAEAESDDYSFFPEAQWLIRPAAKGRGLAFAAKGGHNGEPHNHNDVGAFMLVAADDLFLADLGPGEYTKDYFGQRRYDIFGPSSLSHSVPLVGGRGQSAGASYGAAEAALSRSDDRLVFSLDIAGAYGEFEGRLRRLRRRFSAAAAGIMNRLFLTDEFDIDPDGLPIGERFISLICPELDPGGAVVRLRGKTGVLRITAEGPLDGVDIQLFNHRTHDGRNQAVYAIDYTVRSAEGHGRCEFAFHYENTG